MMLHSKNEPDIPEIYVDGSDITFGTVVSKLNFYSVTEVENSNGDEIEKQTTKLRVVLPTVALAEFCIKVVAALKQNEEVIREGWDKNNNQLFQILENIGVVDGTKT